MPWSKTRFSGARGGFLCGHRRGRSFACSMGLGRTFGGWAAIASGLLQQRVPKVWRAPKLERDMFRRTMGKSQAAAKRPGVHASAGACC